jgi:hypothetical protein
MVSSRLPNDLNVLSRRLFCCLIKRDYEKFLASVTLAAHSGMADDEPLGCALLAWTKDVSRRLFRSLSRSGLVMHVMRVMDVMMHVMNGRPSAHHPWDRGRRSWGRGLWRSASGSASYCVLRSSVTREADRESGGGDKALNHRNRPC